MAKWANDLEMDAALDWIAACDRMFVCSAQPGDYADASGTVDLATVTMTAVTDYTKADHSPNGRQITVAAKAGNTVDHTGTATHIALGKVSDTSLRYVTTCTSQSLTAGNTVDVPTWVISISDPT
jgi:hypothetical protein